MSLISGNLNSDSKTCALKEGGGESSGHREKRLGINGGDGRDWSSVVGVDVVRLEEAELDSCLMVRSLKASSNSNVSRQRQNRRYI